MKPNPTRRPLAGISPGDASATPVTEPGADNASRPTSHLEAAGLTGSRLSPLLEEDPPPPPARRRAYRVEASFAVFGFEVEGGYVTGLVVPIFWYARGWTEAKALRYCVDRGWRIAEVIPA